MLRFQLRWLVVRNQIVDDSNSKPSKLDCWLRYKSYSKTTIESTILILIKIWSLFDWSRLIWNCFQLKDWKRLPECLCKALVQKTSLHHLCATSKTCQFLKVLCTNFLYWWFYLFYYCSGMPKSECPKTEKRLKPKKSCPISRHRHATSTSKIWTLSTSRDHFIYKNKFK